MYRKGFEKLNNHMNIYIVGAMGAMFMNYTNYSGWELCCKSNLT